MGDPLSALAPLLEAALLSALVLVRLAVAHGRHGLSVLDLAFAALVVPSVLIRLLAARGRVKRPVPLALLVELVAFSGLLAAHIEPRAFLLLLALAAYRLLARAARAPSADAPRASVLEDALAVAPGVACGALAYATLGRVPGPPGALFALAMLVVEAFGPYAPRTVGAAARRATAFAVVGAALLAGEESRSDPGVTAILGTAAACVGFAAALAVLARVFAMRSVSAPRDVLETLVASGDGRAAWLAHVLGVAVLGTGLVAAGFLRIPCERALEPAAIEAEDGLAVRTAAPEIGPFRDGEEPAIAVLENGVALGPANARQATVRSRGLGAHALADDHLVFSSSDGTDPRRNGRRYVLQFDRRVAPGLLIVLVLAFSVLNARRVTRLLAQLDTIHPGWIAAALFLVALVFRGQVAAREPEITFSGHLVKGSIFSDARDWYTTAAEFSKNVRWNRCWEWCDARRPFHYVFYGSVFAIFGASLSVARILNVVLAALSTALIFDTLRRVATRPVAVASALAFGLLLYDARDDLSVMTEPVGAFFAVLSLWCSVAGASALLAGGGGAAPLFGAGLALALSNLARPLTIPAAGGIPVALALIASRARVPARRTAGAVAVFILGFAVAVGPWLVRQRVVHGVWTLSENTADMLYGATSPDHAGWSAEVSALPRTHSVKERVEFFMAGVKRNLTEHTAWYARHVLDELVLAEERVGPEGWTLALVAAACLARALASLEANARRAFALAIASGVSVALAFAPGVPLDLLALAGIAWAVFRRRSLTLLAGLHVPTVLAIAMVSASGDRRFTHAFEWCSTAFAAALLARALRVGPDTRAREDLAWGSTGNVVRRGAFAVAALLLAGTLRALTVTPAPSPGDPEVPVAPWVERVLGDRVDRATLAPRLLARRVSVRPGFVMHFAAGETVEHWCPMFDRRPYERTIVETVPELPELYAVLPGPPPRLAPDDELLLVGVPVARPRFGSTFEVLAYGVVHAGESLPRELVRAPIDAIPR